MHEKKSEEIFEQYYTAEKHVRDLSEVYSKAVKNHNES